MALARAWASSTAPGARRMFRNPALKTLLKTLAAMLAVVVGLSSQPVFALSRIKDLAAVEGVRTNQLLGYGIVVGLNGTGDTLNNTPFTKQSLQAMLERLGVNTRGANMRTANVAAVMVTANLPPFFSTQGTRVDVTVSAMGDAKSLQGGTLLVTPLLGADGEVYAVSQGPVAISGFYRGRGQQDHPRRADRRPHRQWRRRRARDRLRLEQAPDAAPVAAQSRPDHRSPYGRRDQRIRRRRLRADRTSRPSFQVIPARFKGNMIKLLTDIEQLCVEPDQLARIVIDYSASSSWAGRMSASPRSRWRRAISPSRSASSRRSRSPSPSPRGQTVVTPRTNVKVDTGGGNKLALVKESVTLAELADASTRWHRPARPDLHLPGHQVGRRCRPKSR